MRRARLLRAAATAIAVVLTASCSGGPAPLPDALELPAGFQPEGIAAGPGSSFFVGSIPTGAVYRGDVRSGEGSVLVAARQGRAAIGLEDAGGRLFVAGGPTGRAFIYDSRTGADVATVLLTSQQPSFINDVAVTDTSAFFTDSLSPVIYRVDRETLEVASIALTGDLVYEEGFNANGIEATADGRALVIVQTNTGELFTVEAGTGATRRIDLAGDGPLPGGDGLLLSGRTLYVAQNSENQIAVVRVDTGLATGTVVGRITDARFDAPTTIAAVADHLYVVNARVDLADPGTAAYRVVRVERR